MRKIVDLERFRDQLLFLAQSLQRMLEAATYVVCDYGSRAEDEGFKTPEPLCGQEITYYRSDGVRYVINIVPALTNDDCEVIIVEAEREKQVFVIRNEETEHEMFVEIHEYVSRIVQRFEQSKPMQERRMYGEINKT